MIPRFTALAVLLLLGASPAGAATSQPWAWPLQHHTVDERFDPPASPYGAGHRGVDIAANAGDAVRAVAAGRVSFAGQVGGTGVLTIDHGSERSTYQPVRARVSVGDAVRRGQVVGTLLGTPSHCVDACLHLGRLIGEDYRDPLDLLGGGRFRLISPHGTPPPPPVGTGGDLVRPVGGPITSPYGMRVHPVTRARKLHDGTDFGVPCGTPVHAAASGTVVARSYRGAYGRQIVIRHRSGFETSYSHLSVQSVAMGARVTSGEVIGRSGTTGLSTGCHLHFMVVRSGKPVNPQDFL
ncbi:hypothetical protein C6I20_09695 [Aeromicrobium sp. A1-2]|uniref:peptidoglycan DD-metalloendopeptidase family protein n=1 Tax=Aeromicrobium sp. A1-2 TaxID=2107713 RepID=UPI000E4B9F59|nr:peptidoglycan DD-metalloendopeptidase family protein [Aeromicrobium sp. A1-2]AXT85435.1 hypothetical protein C6I20_09695 [Aeromicrobium sp. A1-2]